MPTTRCTYDYAVIRVVPRVEREEFVNARSRASSSSTRASRNRFSGHETITPALTNSPRLLPGKAAKCCQTPTPK